MGKQAVNNEVNIVHVSRKEREFDQKQVPSRLAEHYTYFGWVRSKKGLNQEADRKVAGVRLCKKDDQYHIETIRRKKRFALNSRLMALEYRYMTCLRALDKKKYRSSKPLGFFGIVFLVLCAIFLTVGIVKAPSTVLEANELSGLKKTVVELTDDINEILFYGKGYYVKDTEIDKNTDEEGKTTVSLDGEFTEAYSFDDGQLMSTDIEDLKEKMAEQIRKENELEEDAPVDLSIVTIIKCEKAYDNPFAEKEEVKEASAYFRYFIYYDDSYAPLNALVGIMDTLNLSYSPALLFGIVFGIIAIILIICSLSIRSKRNNLRHQEAYRSEAKSIVAGMQQQYPSLMTKSQRHFHSWQQVLTGAINASNASKNDNSDSEMDGFDEY